MIPLEGLSGHSHDDDRATYNLIVAIIHQAVRDYVGTSTDVNSNKSLKKKVREEANKWLRSDTAAMMFEAIGIDIDAALPAIDAYKKRIKK